MKLHLLTGSTNDWEKIHPGLVQFTTDFPDLVVQVYFASADNGPEKVDMALIKIFIETDAPRVLSSGAGMANILTGVVKQSAELSDLVLGMPISDSMFAGLSSFLSTSEKPPRNAVLTVPIDQSYTAANVARKFLLPQERRIVVVQDLYEGEKERRYQREVAANVGAELKRYQLEFSLLPSSAISSDDLVITPFCLSPENPGYLTAYATANQRAVQAIDTRLSQGTGIQIAVKDTSRVLYPGNKQLSPEQEDNQSRAITAYHHLVSLPLPSTGFTSAGWYVNAAQLAAVLARNQTALAQFGTEKTRKAVELAAHPGYLVQAGRVIQLS